jgi:hypothetical protein
MSFLKKVKDIGSDIAETSKRGAQRGKLELDVRRIEGKMEDEKKAIGLILFNLMETGVLQVDNDDVKTHLASLETLHGELAEKHREIDNLKETDAVTADTA